MLLEWNMLNDKQSKLTSSLEDRCFSLSRYLVDSKASSCRSAMVTEYKKINYPLQFTINLFTIFSPQPKIANCGEVCASQLVPLRHKPQEDDDNEQLLVIFKYTLTHTSRRNYKILIQFQHGRLWKYHIHMIYSTNMKQGS